MASRPEIWLVDFGDPYPGEPASYRPAIVVGPPASFGANFPFSIVVPCTTVRRGLSVHVELAATGLSGLDDVSYAQCELIRSVNRRRLVHRLGLIDEVEAATIDEVVQTLLGR